MSKTYFIIAEKNEVGDRFAYVYGERDYFNLNHLCDPVRDAYGNVIGEIEYFCACDTKANALKTAANWNETWERDGQLWRDAPIHCNSVFLDWRK